MQSVVNYPSTDAAREFFDRSSDRWSKCTNHNVNITLNGQPLPKWHSGELTKTDTELSIPFTRDNDGGQDLCQRVLSVENNVIIAGLFGAALGLGLSEAAYMAEIARAGILSVDPGSARRPRPSGMSSGKAMRRVVLPQAMRVIVPPTGNETIAMVKDTSLLIAIPVSNELFFQLSSIGHGPTRPSRSWSPR